MPRALPLRPASLLALLCALLAGSVLAGPAARAQQQDTSGVSPEQPGVALALGGTLQPRFSYAHAGSGEADGDERVGFGLRRARLRFEAELAGRAGASLQLGAAGTAAELFDAFVFFDMTEAWRLRLGRFAPAQPRAAQLTSHTRIDLVARAAVAQRWGAATLANDGRDFGLEALYETGRFDVQAGLYNGNGGWDRALGNVREDITGDPTGGVYTRGLAAGAYGAWRPAALPGLEVGGHASYNAARSNEAARPPEVLLPPSAAGRGALAEETRSYASYSGHLYWGARPGAQPVRLKADLIGTRYESLDYLDDAGSPNANVQTLEQHALGASLLAAVGLADQSAELLARFERYDLATGRDGNAQDYLSAGASVSPSALRGRPYRRQRLTLAYATRLSSGDDGSAHLLVFQAQLVF